ncbi:MAG: hypothetical protein A2Y79_09655 [Deltaproteobacteria bacterium RBG_13_43_22]|nr:MAG: hypothetical protein A2Y79_09655 [Deltaproteobacteria bacterium RBG_13_43_22]
MLFFGSRPLPFPLLLSIFIPSLPKSLFHQKTPSVPLPLALFFSLILSFPFFILFPSESKFLSNSFFILFSSKRKSFSKSL